MRLWNSYEIAPVSISLHQTYPSLLRKGEDKGSLCFWLIRQKFPPALLHTFASRLPKAIMKRWDSQMYYHHQTSNNQHCPCVGDSPHKSTHEDPTITSKERPEEPSEHLMPPQPLIILSKAFPFQRYAPLKMLMLLGSKPDAWLILALW